jgi:hypothetical protein
MSPMPALPSTSSNRPGRILTGRPEGFDALDQAPLLRRARRGDGEHDLLDLVADDRIGQVGGRVDRQAGDDLPLQVGRGRRGSRRRRGRG